MYAKNEWQDGRDLARQTQRGSIVLADAVDLLHYTSKYGLNPPQEGYNLHDYYSISNARSIIQHSAQPVGVSILESNHVSNLSLSRNAKRNLSTSQVLNISNNFPYRNNEAIPGVTGHGARK